MDRMLVQCRQKSKNYALLAKTSLEFAQAGIRAPIWVLRHFSSV